MNVPAPLSPIMTGFCRDASLLLARPGHVLLVPGVFVLLITLWGLSLARQDDVLAQAAPGLLTLSLVLAALWPLDRLFAADLENRTLPLLRTMAVPLPLVIGGKFAAHWGLYALPLLVIAPLCLPVLGLPLTPALSMLGVLFPASLALTLIAAPAAALLSGVRQGGVLLLFVVLPFMLPVLIFCTGALTNAVSGLPAGPALLYLWAMVAAFVPLSPVICAAIIGTEYE